MPTRSPSGRPHFPAKAKRVIHLFMNGGPEPRRHVRPQAGARQVRRPEAADARTSRTERKTGAAFPSPFKFQKYGQSGIEVSELFAQTAEHIDDICVIRSMHADVPNHEPSLLLMNCGEARLARPSMGSWVTYGLGTENQNLPGFVAMCPGGYPIQETQNWQSGVPARASTRARTSTRSTPTSRSSIENIRNTRVAADRASGGSSTCCSSSTSSTRPARRTTPQLEARIQSFELAYRMQTEAAEAFDVSREPKHVREAYGDRHAGPADC